MVLKMFVGEISEGDGNWSRLYLRHNLRIIYIMENIGSRFQSPPGEFYRFGGHVLRGLVDTGSVFRAELAQNRGSVLIRL